jgi:DAACS family dicarboxylate/amino acid:cation (Na+ or H+) symporter
VRLQTKILLGLLVGLLLGTLARMIPGLRTAIEWIEPVGTVFIRLITMVVIPLVVGSLFTSVASLGNIRRLGSIGVRALGWFVSSTAIAAVIGMAVALLAGVGSGLDPSVRDAITDRFASSGTSASANVSAVPSLKQTLIAIVPQNPFAAAAQGDLLALIFAVVLFAAAATALDEERRRPLVSFFASINDVSMVVIRWLMVVAPWAVGVLIAVTVVRSGIDLLRSLATYALIVIAALLVHVVVVLLPVIRFGARMGVGAFVRNVGDALVLAFSTASSSVTLPVAMNAARTRLGIPGEVVSFVLPTGTTLNKNGAAVYKAATAVFLANLYGVDLGPGQLVTIVLTTIMASSAGAGVPGSSLVTTLIVLNAIGLGPNAAAGIALVAGIDRALDMCRTTVNTFSNLVGAAWINRGEQDRAGVEQAAAT